MNQISLSKKKPRKNSDKFGDRLLTFIFYPLRFFLYFFLFQFVFRILFKFNHKLKFNKNGKKLPPVPFLVLGNHVTDWDGLYLNTYLKKFIYFLVHDEVFKYKYRKIIAYNILGQIKRGKTKNDIGPLRKMIELKQAGKCLGIFPEGDISYSGRSLEIRKSISKLCKILDMPIVLSRIDGATYQRPRWSYEIRKTPVTLTITDVISVEDVRNLSEEDFYDRIVKGISYNDNEYQKINLNRMKAKNPAERLEYVLFLCPDCNKTGSLKTKGKHIFCENCGYKAEYNLYNQFELISGKRHLLNIGEWDDYQKSRLEGIIAENKKTGGEILSYGNFSYNRVLRGDFFYRPQSRGTLSLNHERIKFVSDDNSIIEEYNIKDIKDLYIQFKGAVEFSSGKYRYRFKSRNKQHYGYWYECFINRIIETI